MIPSGPNPNALSFKDKLKLLLSTKVDTTTITWADLATAIGPNADKYEKLWLRMHSESKNPFKNFSLCWSAIPFFGVPWAVARKMPAWAAIMFVAMVIAASVIPSDAGAMGLAFALSASQKSMYLRWLSAHIQLINNQGLLGEARQQALQAVGGLDAKSGWITAAVLLGVSVLLAVAIV